jgi:Tol biopolymer transport system component
MKSVLALFLGLALAATASAFERINVSTAGDQANDEGFFSEVSSDGRYVIFESRATNLIPNDTNFVGDVFLRDRQLQTTELLSVGLGGGLAFGGISTHPHLSADIAFAAFSSRSTNLVAGDLNGVEDAFVRDLGTGAIERISVHTNGTEGDGASQPHGMSADGRYVVFKSFATNLVDSDTNTTPDIFVRDRMAGTTERANVSSTGSEGNQAQVPDPFAGSGSITADGGLVAFATIASDLVAGDTNAATDAFVRDRVAGTTTLVSVSTGGVQGDDETRMVLLSANGRYAAMASLANNLVAVDSNAFTADIFLRDLATGETTLVNRNAQGTQSVNNILHGISADGRFVVWSTTTVTLIPNDPETAPNVFDVFVYDGSTGEIARVTAGSNTTEASGRATISADGRTIAFRSGDPDLVGNDTNGLNDYFTTENPLAGPPVPSAPGWARLGLALALMGLASAGIRRAPRRRETAQS